LGAFFIFIKSEMMKYFSLLILAIALFACNSSSKQKEDEKPNAYNVRYYIEADESTYIEDLKYLNGKGEWVEVKDAEWTWELEVDIPKGSNAGIQATGGSNNSVKFGYVAELGVITRKYGESQGSMGFGSFDISFEKTLE
jgi:hypothetical protein